MAALPCEILDSAMALGDSWLPLGSGGDPFCSPAFLGAAEHTGAAAADMGWQARHLALRDSGGEIAALLPLYLRDHSFGDFARDWGWAGAWQRAGLDYYPKLVSGIPYTPSPGPRLLVAPGQDRAIWAARLLDAAIAYAGEVGASSWQCLFVREEDRRLLAEAGLLLRRGVQFHWQQRGYRDFEDFLTGFTSEKRKKLRRERRAVAESGLHIEARHGDEIDSPLWAAIHRHYTRTFRRYGNHPAFPLDFFTRAGRALGRQLVVFVAWENETPCASAICYRDDHTLFGRHWGCDRDVPGLHFELCYYQGIDYCLAHGLQRFEPGAQGEHKLARGFEPTDTWSAFWIADRRMRAAVADFVAREDAAMADYAAEAATHLPFRTGG